MKAAEWETLKRIIGEIAISNYVGGGKRFPSDSFADSRIERVASCLGGNP